MSLSARRAWIEIEDTQGERGAHSVALRKESVDRNATVKFNRSTGFKSLSARRAWIEILLVFCGYLAIIGSLSARRAWIEI